MNMIFVTAILALLPLYPSTQVPPAAKKTALEGTWIITAIGGQPVPPSRGEMALVVAGDTYQQLSDGKRVEHGLVQIGSAKETLTVDFVIVGPDQKPKARQLGLCRVIKAELSCKLSQPGAVSRPTDMSPASGFFQFVAKKR